MHRTIIVGSPRIDGRSASLAQQIFDACIEDCPDDGVSILTVSDADIAGCIGCNACKPAVKAEGLSANGEAADSADENSEEHADDPLTPVYIISKSDAASHVCIYDDDMTAFRKHLDAADELIVVCPVYFSGAPSQMKAMLDRMQPYYWSNVLKGKGRRPFTLHVVGDGGDPYGFDALVSVIRSALSVAGFQIERLLDWTGCIDASGNITCDASEKVMHG